MVKNLKELQAEAKAAGTAEVLEAVLAGQARRVAQAEVDRVRVSLERTLARIANNPEGRDAILVELAGDKSAEEAPLEETELGGSDTKGKKSKK